MKTHFTRFILTPFSGATGVSQNLNMALIILVFESNIVEVGLHIINWLQNLFDYFLKNCRCGGNNEAESFVGIESFVSRDDYMPL